ncbi:MAG: flagellar biosynthetic protein FliO [Armatimonadetes bacterium]|nr:flagellar biosynthetic protein FliO [Armatimonadota bacterium]
MAELDVYMARAFVALLVIVFLAMVAWVLARHRLYPQQRLGGRHLEVVEKLPLGPRSRLLIVRAGERTFLIGETLQSVSFLTEVDLYCPGESPQSKGDDGGSDSGS